MAEGGIPCSYNCIICGQDGLSEREMRSHILTEHVESSVCCPFCDIQCSSIEQVEDHLYSEHLELLSPNKRRNPDSELVDHGRVRDMTTHQPKSVAKKGKKAPYVNLEYFNKTLVDMPTSDVSCKTVNIGGDSLRHSSSTTDVMMADSTSQQDNIFTNSETGEKIYKLPVSHILPKSDVATTPLTKTTSLASKRARLSLDVSPSSKNSASQDTSSSTSSGSDFHCPLCKYATSSESEIQRHVNLSHLDVLSPAKPQSSSDKSLENGAGSESEQYMEIIPEGDPMPSTSHMVYECPICSMHHDSSLSLEFHVNSKHSDVLSPDVPASESDSVLAEATTTCGMDDENLCPVCSVNISDPVAMSAHVEIHFTPEQSTATTNANQLPSDAELAADLVNRELMDEILAKELAEKERLQQNEEKEFQKLQAQFGMDDKNSYKKQYALNLERAVYKGEISMTEFYDQKSSLAHTGANGIDDGHSCTKGIIECLEKSMKTSQQNVSNVWLSSPLDHYAASHGDKGWGCGYRNFQMLLSSLANQDGFLKTLFNGRPIIPSIPKIQRLIETAWEKGFDIQGAEQLGRKLVNTTKWIGATEITATLLSLGVRCDLIDFHRPTGPGGTHPSLLNWVREYFSQPDLHKAPLYFQHHGHSRTIIGIEELKDNNLRLLLFDPSCSKRQMSQLTGLLSSPQLRTLRRTAQSLKAKQYQIVAVRGILDERDYEKYKVIRSQRIP